MNHAERKTHFLYNVMSKYTAGMILNSEHIIAIRNSRFNIQNAFINITNSHEAILKNVKIYDESIEIKLLLKRNEIKKIYSMYSKKGVLIVPIYIQRINKYYRIIIAVCTYKTQYDRRESLKQKDIQKRSQYEVSEYYE